MNSSSSIPYGIRRTADSFSNGKFKEQQINIEITPKKNSSPSSPGVTERNIVIDIQKRTDFVNVQTNTPHYEPSTPIYRASPFRKVRLNYSEYTNPGRSPNSSNYLNSSVISNSNNNSKTHKNRSVHLSSSTIAELSENNYRTFDPVTPKSSGNRRKQNQIPKTEPRPKLRALHHFTPPRYEPRPPTQGKAYLSQLSEDSGSSVYIDSSMALLSEKGEEENAEEYEYESNEEILPITRGPRYHFIVSSSDLTNFSDEQNSSSNSRRSSKNKPRSTNSASNYSNYSYSNYSNTEENPEEDNNSYKSDQHSHRSRHNRHSYSHASVKSGHHSSHQSRSKNSVENIRRSRREQVNDEEDQSLREEKEYSNQNDMQTPVQPRYTIHGTKRSPPKTQPAKKSSKSRNVNLDESNSEIDNYQPSKQIHSNTQKIERTSENHKHHSHTKSNASSSQMSKSVHSHGHSRTSRKSEPYYIRMKFVNSEELIEIDPKDVKDASFHKFSNVGDAFSFQDTTNYYATLSTINNEYSSPKQPKKQNDAKTNLIMEEEEFSDDENPYETGSKTKTKEDESKKTPIETRSTTKKEEDEPNFDFEDSKDEENLHETDSKNTPNTKTKEEQEENTKPQIKTRSTTQNADEESNSKKLTDEEFQRMVEIPPEVYEKMLNVDNSQSIKNSIKNKNKSTGKYEYMEEGLIEKVEEYLKSKNDNHRSEDDDEDNESNKNEENESNKNDDEDNESNKNEENESNKNDDEDNESNKNDDNDEDNESNKNDDEDNESNKNDEDDEENESKGNDNSKKDVEPDEDETVSKTDKEIDDLINDLSGGSNED